MTQFTYTARSTDGKRHQGSIDAENLNTAMELLANKNLSVIKLDEKDVIRHELVKSIIIAYKK